MPITIDDLTVNFTHLDPKTLLDDWQWLTGTSKRPILLLAIGDAVVQDINDGSVYLIDVGIGELVMLAKSYDEFRASLTDAELVMNWFAVNMVMELKQANVNLETGQVYSFKKPPMLGGEYTIENFEPTDIAVHFSLFGQIHHQLKDVPDGTPITGFTISQPEARG